MTLVTHLGCNAVTPASYVPTGAIQHPRVHRLHVVHGQRAVQSMYTWVLVPYV